MRLAGLVSGVPDREPGIGGRGCWLLECVAPTMPSSWLPTMTDVSV